MILGGIHTAPKEISISSTVNSSGCTAFKASIFLSKEPFSFNNSACFNFSLTFPDKYSSATTQKSSPRSFDIDGSL